MKESLPHCKQFAVLLPSPFENPDLAPCVFPAANKVLYSYDSALQACQRVMQGRAFNDPEDAGTKKSLIAAQRAWVKFREADCNAVYEQWKTGTIRTVMFIECMQKRAETRIKELEEYQPR
jgi:uncharacterized protein YecT (DUF1311 family)